MIYKQNNIKLQTPRFNETVLLSCCLGTTYSTFISFTLSKQNSSGYIALSPSAKNSNLIFEVVSEDG